MSAELAFQAGLLGHLSASPSVQAVFGHPARLFDRAPGGIAYPFLSLGRAESESADADGIELVEHRLTLHVWGRRDDADSVKTGIGAVRKALRAGLPELDGPWRCVTCHVVYADVFSASDSRLLHALVRVRALIEAG
ncbi:DUF3168 domain-containing protein [Marinicauda pacifica]|uniref:DUF3168 domain-containing protein n=1 Tax=Marinicauda pacifica TaxID=1133559 RepID=UPI0035C84C64